MTKIRFLLITLVALGFPGLVHSYVGPGTGLSAIGSVLGFLIVILLLIVGLLWYPLRKLISWYKSKAESKAGIQSNDEDG